MDSSKFISDIRDRIVVEMVKQDMSKQTLSQLSGIPYTTLDRRLRTQPDFTAREISMIATALGVPFTRLLPYSHATENAPAKAAS